MIPGATDDADFDGKTYKPKLDRERLARQQKRVYNCMADGEWRTLGEIAQRTGDPEASISARLRDLRKKKFGAHTVNRQRRGDPADGIFEYQLIPNLQKQIKVSVYE